MVIAYVKILGFVSSAGMSLFMICYVCP